MSIRASERAGAIAKRRASRGGFLIGACAALSALGATGCVGNDEIVFVDPSIEDAQVTVTSKTLGTDLSGSFHLVFLLGPRASGPSQVSLQSFEITSADQKKSIVPSLKTTSDKTFPITVELDSEVSATLTIDLGGALLPSSAADDLCGAGGLKIAGTIQDSLQSGGATPVASPVFQPSGCPQK